MLPAEHCTLRTLEQDGQVRIELAETGKVLTPEECFPPSHSLLSRRSCKARGLDWPSCIRSQRSHGHISVDHDEAAAQRFRIDLPHVKLATPPLRGEASSEKKSDAVNSCRCFELSLKSTQAWPRKAHLLLVDDDP